MKRVFIIHGWSGFPGEGWFPWLQDALESKGIWTSVPTMPNPDEPIIDAWNDHLAKVVGAPDSETYFIGHSIGCSAVLQLISRLNKNISEDTIKTKRAIIDTGSNISTNTLTTSFATRF